MCCSHSILKAGLSSLNILEMNLLLSKIYLTLFLPKCTFIWFLIEQQLSLGFGSLFLLKNCCFMINIGMFFSLCQDVLKCRQLNQWFFYST